MTGVITPDIVAQKSAAYGIVGEAKKTLDRDEDHWQCHLDQLRSYDEDLLGWWTPSEAIVDADATLLVHQSRGTRFAKFFESDPDKVGPHSSVIEFNQSDDRVPYIFFRLAAGAVRDPDFAAQLDEGTMVPIESVLKTFGPVDFYDANPPMTLLLQKLWMEYIPSLVADAIVDPENKGRRIKVSVAEATNELQRAYGSGVLVRDERSASFPQVSWIRQALDRLVEYKLALPPSGDTDEYTVLYRSFNEDVREHFAGLETARHAKAASEAEDQELPFGDVERV